MGKAGAKSIPTSPRSAPDAPAAAPAGGADPPRTADALLHELQVHQIELEMQNEELLRSQAALEASRERFADLYEFAPVAYLTLTRGARITAANRMAAMLLGQSAGKLKGRSFTALVAPLDAGRWKRIFADAIVHADLGAVDLRLVRPDGRPLAVRLACLCRGEESSSVRITLMDVTDSKRAEDDLRIAALAFETDSAVVVTDAGAVIVRVNGAYTRLTGYSSEESVGRTPAMLKSSRHDRVFYEQLWASLTTHGSWRGEIWNRDKSGLEAPALMIISAARNAEGVVTHYVATFSDITLSKQVEAQIHRLAYYDSLTQLPNRVLLHDRITHAMVSMRRSQQFGALLFVDLDHFKGLNDSRGHASGDRLLVEVARRIAGSVREDDTIARLGGDEFVVMLDTLGSDPTEAARQAAQIADKVRRAIDQPFPLERGIFRCTASIGVALFRGDELAAETVLKNADLAMYKAKDAGRNAVRLFDPVMQTALDERAAIESDLLRAVERGQLSLYYQAQANAQGRIIGAEALLRWHHPQRGLLLPAAFLAIAQETDLIVSLGRWVLDTACAQIRAWSRLPAARHLRVAVNISARELRHPHFPAFLAGVLRETGVDPERLLLELAENDVFADADETIARLGALKALGVGLCLDDFGAGLSSLAHLRRLPLGQLKIGAAVIGDLAGGSRDAAIVKTILALGSSLGLEVIAEGVASEPQMRALADLGCRVFQGSHPAPPLPVREFEQLLPSVTEPG